MKKRCFVSIDIPENVKKYIEEIQNQLPEFIGKKTEIKNLHLTLKFIGEINEDILEKINNQLNKIKFQKINLKINSIGVFSKKFIRIIWIHLKGCEEFQKIIDEKISELNSFKKEKRFMSHLTIGRVKKIKDRKAFLQKIEQIKIPEIDFTVENFKLKESILKPEGPIYRDLAIYSLN